MQIISGILGAINCTITTTITPDQVERLLISCENKKEFRKRVFHVVKREAQTGKTGYNVYPKEFIGVDEYWDAFHGQDNNSLSAF